MRAVGCSGTRPTSRLFAAPSAWTCAARNTAPRGRRWSVGSTLFQGRPRRYAAEFSEGDHPRDGNGQSKSTGGEEHRKQLAETPIGETTHAKGFLVRRTGPKSFRLETLRGHVTGDADVVLQRIEREGQGQAPGPKRARPALERAEQHQSGSSWFGSPDLEAHAKAFQALPRGTRVVSLEE